MSCSFKFIFFKIFTLAKVHLWKHFSVSSCKCMAKILHASHIDVDLIHFSWSGRFFAIITLRKQLGCILRIWYKRKSPAAQMWCKASLFWINHSCRDGTSWTLTHWSTLLCTGWRKSVPIAANWHLSSSWLIPWLFVKLIIARLVGISLVLGRAKFILVVELIVARQLGISLVLGGPSN